MNEQGGKTKRVLNEQGETAECFFEGRNSRMFGTGNAAACCYVKFNPANLPADQRLFMLQNFI
jgi:hypothetical protein